MEDKVLSFIGLCRKAGRLSSGHDAALEAVIKNKARLCLLTADASDRLVREFKKAAEYDGRRLDVIQTAYTMEQIRAATGLRAAVITIDDEGFAKKTAKLYKAVIEEETL